MKKVFLGLAMVTALLVVSCKEETKDKVEEATEAVGEDIKTSTEEAAEKIDSTANKVEKEVKEEVEYMDERVD
ncbi:hypothetical protein [Flavobacterium sp. U410]|jgi:gas vesicle protein